MQCLTRKLVVNTLLASCLLVRSAGALCQAAPEYQLDIGAQQIPQALQQLATATKKQLLFSFELMGPLKSTAVTGTHSLQEALDIILQGTQLSGELTEDGVILITPKKPTSEAQGETNVKAQNNPSTKQVNTNKTLLATIIAMLFGTGVNAQAVDANQNPDAEQAKTEQSEKASWERIEVTATKRSAWLQDIPAAITAIGAEEIDKRGLKSMGDYLSTVPGVTIQDRGAGSNSITMRGLSTSPQRERTAVGVYFGDTSVSGMTNGPDVVSSDLRMVDIERVEILKGPQGTLYGADAMGGIVRIIPASPDLDIIEGKVEAQYSKTAQLGGNNYQLKGVLNLPFFDNTLAVRGVSYYYDNSGYIENIAGSYEGETYPTIRYGQLYGAILNDEADIGSDITNGFRLAVLWQPTENLTAKLNHTWQKIEQKGLRQVSLNLPEKYQQVMLEPWPNITDSEGHMLESNGIKEEVSLSSLVFDYELVWGTVSSVSSWTNRDGLFYSDATYNYNLPDANSLVGYGNRFSQELRFSSRFEGPLQFLMGAYYEKYDNSSFIGEYYTGDPAFAAEANEDSGRDAWIGHQNDPFYFYYNTKETVDQRALFAEASYNITDTLVATTGVRYYKYNQTNYAEGAGYYYRTDTLGVRTDLEGDNSGDTWKVNISWNIDDNAMAYAQWAQGFRLGRNLDPKPESLGCDKDGNGFYEVQGGGEVPIINGVMDPDTTNNYEIGYKGSFANNRVTLNTALYHIEWKGLPAAVQLTGLCSGYYANAGESKSEGIEIESSVHVNDVLLMNIGVSYNSAELTTDSSLGASGDELPGSADFNLSAGLEYSFKLFNKNAFIRADYSYVGEYTVLINQPDTTPSLGDYSQFHIKAGVAFNNLAIDVFVNNLTNSDALTWINQTGIGKSWPHGYRLRPRSLGVNVNYRF